MNNKIYIVILKYQDCLSDELFIELATTSKSTAQNKLKELADIECRTSWIQNYGEDEFDRFDITQDYFGAKYDDKITEIWIEEKEIEE